MILRRRLKGVVSSPALCPEEFSSEVPTRNDRRHWPPSVFLSLLDPWSRVVQLHQQCTIDSFVSRSQSCGPSRVTFQQAFNSPPTFAVSCASPACPVLKYRHPGQPSLIPQSFEVWSLRMYVLATLFSISTSPGSEAPYPRASPFRLECRMQCHCHLETTEQLAFRVFGPRPISPTQEFS